MPPLVLLYCMLGLHLRCDWACGIWLRVRCERRWCFVLQMLCIWCWDVDICVDLVLNGGFFVRGCNVMDAG